MLLQRVPQTTCCSIGRHHCHTSWLFFNPLWARCGSHCYTHLFCGAMEWQVALLYCSGIATTTAMNDLLQHPLTPSLHQLIIFYPLQACCKSHCCTCLFCGAMKWQVVSLDCSGITTTSAMNDLLRHWLTPLLHQLIVFYPLHACCSSHCCTIFLCGAMPQCSSMPANAARCCHCNSQQHHTGHFLCMQRQKRSKE